MERKAAGRRWLLFAETQFRMGADAIRIARRTVQAANILRIIFYTEYAGTHTTQTHAHQIGQMSATYFAGVVRFDMPTSK